MSCQTTHSSENVSLLKSIFVVPDKGFEDLQEGRGGVYSQNSSFLLDFILCFF